MLLWLEHKFNSINSMKQKIGRPDNLESFDCEFCLNYEWFGVEDGYQCRYPFAPPCDEPEWPIGDKEE
mgnify:CR=1 FL=1